MLQVGDDILGLFPILDCFYTFLPIVRGRFDVLEVGHTAALVVPDRWLHQELSYEFCRGRKEENIIYTEVLRWRAWNLDESGRFVVLGRCITR